MNYAVVCRIVRIYFSCDKIIMKITINILTMIPDKVTCSRLFIVCVVGIWCNIPFHFCSIYGGIFVTHFWCFVTGFFEGLFFFTWFLLGGCMAGGAFLSMKGL
jgi:hypothetical protein